VVTWRTARDTRMDDEVIFSASEFVTALYRGLLGRDPDPEGMAHALQRLQDPASRPEGLVRDLVVSEEGRAVAWRTTAGLADAIWEASAGQPRQGPPLYFLHIMKTGGTALASALRRLLPPNLALPHLLLDHLVVLPPSILTSVRLVAGHLTYEATELLPAGLPVCTVIRDPVERTLSHFHHLRNDPTVMAEVPDFSLELFLDSPRWRTLCRNYQARQLVHRIDLAGAWVRFSPPDRFGELGPPFPAHHPLPLQSLFDCTPLHDDEATLTEKSVRRLDDIEFVGVTERLDQLFGTLARYFQVTPSQGVPRENVGSGRPTVGDLPRSLAQRIRDANRVDQVLYERARGRGAARAHG
jgi:hypothetical protein